MKVEAPILPASIKRNQFAFSITIQRKDWTSLKMSKVKLIRASFLFRGMKLGYCNSYIYGHILSLDIYHIDVCKKCLHGAVGKTRLSFKKAINEEFSFKETMAKGFSKSPWIRISYFGFDKFIMMWIESFLWFAFIILGPIFFKIFTHIARDFIVRGILDWRVQRF